MERLYYKDGEPIDDKVLRHLRRYDFCSKRIKKESAILDFGCGSGYGSKTISKRNPDSKIQGYDPSEEAIQYAKTNNAAPNIEFTQQQTQTNNDYVLMIDMIEHLTDQQIEETLEKLTKENKKALFFISTPLNDYEGQSPTNQYHINCFTKPRFTKLLDKHFKHKLLYLIDWCYSRQMNEKEIYGKVMAICKN